MATMRAKFQLRSIITNGYTEELEFAAVASQTPEDNSFSEATPSATCRITITNKTLWGTFKPGQKFYVDFTEAPD